MRGRAEEEFERLVQDGGDVSSISGSDTDSEEEESGGSTAVPRRGGAAGSRPDLSAKVVFSDASGALFALWRAALASPREEKEDVAWARKGSLAPQRLRSLRSSAGLWLLILARGGHFAAIVVRMAAASTGSVTGDAVVAHRTFHRYVVRAKQGGRQGAKDATGKGIKSAGSSLRRANEAALERDVKALLDVEWRAYVASAELIWLAVSDIDRRMIVGGDGAPVAKDDARLRRIPFGTRRPTLNEAKRVAAALAAVEMDIAPALEPQDVQPAPSFGAADASDSSDSDADDAAPPAQYVDPGADPRAGDTPLHTAARAGNAAEVASLLAGGIDPGVRNVRGRVAYSVAANRQTRDAFRRARAAAEDAWDWGAAGVTSALTPEMEAVQAAKRAAASAAERARDKVRSTRHAFKFAACADMPRDGRSASALLKSARTSSSWRRRALHRRLQTARHAMSRRSPPPLQVRGAPRLGQIRCLFGSADARRYFASGSRSKATSLLESARAAERAAREQRAAAAERRFAALGVGDGNGVSRSGTRLDAPQAPAAVPWGAGNIAGGSVVAAAAAAAGTPAALKFGSAAPAFGNAAAAPQPTAVEEDAAVAALLARVTPDQARLLHRILTNAAEHPEDGKLRRLRLSNPKVADALVSSGALDTLLIPRYAWALEAGDEQFVVQSEAAVRLHAPAMLRAAARLLARADATATT